MTVTKDNSMKLRRSCQQGIFFLAIQFLLGMGTNLVGEIESGSMVFTNILLVLHVLTAIVLVGGALSAIPIAAKVDAQSSKLAKIAAGVIVITFAAGVLTVLTHSNWWSFVMAAGFIVSLLLYIRIWTRA